MAVTHSDLAFRDHSTDISSQRALFFMIFSTLSGLLSFILSLAAEATRTQAIWMLLSSGQEGQTSQCVYNSSGRTPLTWSVGAFMALAVAMFTEHAYILVALSNPSPPALIAWSLQDGPPSSSSTASLTWQACFFFLTTWLSFAIAEVLLMIGIGEESGHLTNWKRPRSNCLVVRPGLFAAAGVFGLTTVFLAAGLYLTALRAHRLHQNGENWHQEVRHGSAPLAPAQHRIASSSLPAQSLHAVQANENRQPREDPCINKSSPSA